MRARPLVFKPMFIGIYVYSIMKKRESVNSKLFLIARSSRVGPRFRESRTASLDEKNIKRNRESENVASLKARACEASL